MTPPSAALNVVDILRVGFTGFATILLYLAYNLSRQIIQTPGDLGGIKVKQYTVYFFGVISLIALALSIWVEVRQTPPKPILTEAIVTFDQSEFGTRPISLSFFVPNDVPTSLVLKGQPQRITIPPNTTVIGVDIPKKSESLK